MVFGPLTPFLEPDNFLFGQYYTGEPRNRSHVKDPVLDDLLVRQRRAMDVKARREIINDIQRHLAKQQYYVHAPTGTTSRCGTARSRTTARTWGTTTAGGSSRPGSTAEAPGRRHSGGIVMLGDVVELSVVVRNLDEAIERFTRLFGLRVHHRGESKDFGFKNAILPTGIGHIELMEPTDPTKPVARVLQKNGEGVYLRGIRVQGRGRGGDQAAGRRRPRRQPAPEHRVGAPPRDARPLRRAAPPRASTSRPLRASGASEDDVRAGTRRRARPGPRR